MGSVLSCSYVFSLLQDRYVTLNLSCYYIKNNDLMIFNWVSSYLAVHFRTVLGGNPRAARNYGKDKGTIRLHGQYALNFDISAC